MSEQLFSPDRLAAYVQDAPAPQPTSAQEDDPRLSKLSLAMLLAANTGDTLSTLYGRSRGAVEGNPLYGREPSAARVIATKGLTTLAQVLLLNKIAEHRPEAANLTAKIVSGILGGVTAHNVRVGREQERR